MKHEYDYWPLRRKIKEDYGRYYKFADALGIKQGRLSALLAGRSHWGQELISKAAHLLGIVGEIEFYFFTENGNQR